MSSGSSDVGWSSILRIYFPFTFSPSSTSRRLRVGIWLAMLGQWLIDLDKKRPQLSQSRGRQLYFRKGLGAEYPGRLVSLPQLCEALRTREGRNAGKDARLAGAGHSSLTAGHYSLINRSETSPRG